MDENDMIGLVGRKPDRPGDALASHDAAVKAHEALDAGLARLPNFDHAVGRTKDAVAARRTVIESAVDAFKDIETRRQRLAGTVATLRSGWAPKVDPDQQTSVAMWPSMPKGVELRIMFSEALERDDARTMDAITSLPPGLYPDALPPSEVEEMHRQRLAVEDPERAVKLGEAEDDLSHVDALVDTATGEFTALLNELPEFPDEDDLVKRDIIGAIADGKLVLED